MTLANTAADTRTAEQLLLDQADDLGLTAGERAMLREADRLRYTPKGRPGWRAAHRRAAQIVADIRRDNAASIAAIAKHERSAERGGKANVIKHNDAGALRIVNRDGLQALADAGKLTRDHLGAGMRYRALVEAAEAGDLGSQLRDKAGSGVVDPVAVMAAKSLARIAVSAIERAVALELKGEPLCLVALRQVAGEGRCVRTMASGYRAGERLVVALQSALDLVELHLSNRGR